MICKMLFLFIFVTVAIPQTEGNQTARQNSLMELFNSIPLTNMTNIPPFQDGERTISVTLGVDIPSILRLDIVKQTLVSSLTMGIWWNDDRKTWNPSQFGNHFLVEFDGAELWTPLILIQNTADGKHLLNSFLKIIVMYDGLHISGISDVYKTTCKIDVSLYPFDTQVCSIVVAVPFGFPINLLATKLPVSAGTADLRRENGEWSIKQMQLVKSDLGFVKIVLTLERKYTFYVMNIIFPMALLSVLNSMVFLVPTCSGEKMGFIMTVFTAHVVFLNIIQDFLPTASEQISSLELYLVMNEVQGFLAILLALVVENQYHKAGEVKDKNTWTRLLDCIKRWTVLKSKVHVSAGDMQPTGDQGQRHGDHNDDGVDDVGDGVNKEEHSESKRADNKTLDTVFFFFTFALSLTNLVILIL